MNAEELFESNKYLVKKTIYKTYPDPRGLARINRIELDDLMQIGFTGLWKACLSYQTEKGTKFTTHAINHIKWHLAERLKREMSLIKYDSNKFNEIVQYGLLSIDAEHSDDSEGHGTYHDIIPNEEVNVEDVVFGKYNKSQLLSQLNDRQIEIVKLIEQGLNTNDIARLWDMTGSNVRWHYNKAKKLIEDYCEVI